MALSSGMFNTLNGNPVELNARSFAGQILRRYPNGAAPMFALTSQSGRSKAKASTHGYFSKVMTFHAFVQAAGALVGDTSLAWPSTAGMTVGMLFHNVRTREIVRITAITNGTTVVVTRAFGRVAAAAVNAGDNWIQVGTAFEEGSNRPVSRRLTTEYIPNYTQIFRNAWALTGTAKATLSEMGISNIAENRADCAMFHSVDIESAIIWGQPRMDTTGPTPMHTTQGVIDAMEQYAPQNTNTAGATTTFDQLVALMEPAFENSTNLGNPKERIAFVDKTAMRVFNQIGVKSGQIHMDNSETAFGMKFSRVDFYRGSLNLIEHPLFNGLTQSGTALIMDMSALKLAYMEGRDTMAEDYGINGKAADNGADAVGGSLTTELAVELINPYSCAYITGLTAGAV